MSNLLGRPKVDPWCRRINDSLVICLACGKGRSSKPRKCHSLRHHMWYSLMLSKSRRNYVRKSREYIRTRNLKIVHKMTTEEYDYFLARQKGVCAICHNVTDDGRNLAVDHDHKTKKIRGLLCRNCNLGLGYFKTRKLLKEALKYLG